MHNCASLNGLVWIWVWIWLSALECSFSTSMESIEQAPMPCKRGRSGIVTEGFASLLCSKVEAILRTHRSIWIARRIQNKGYLQKNPTKPPKPLLKRFSFKRFQRLLHVFGNQFEKKNTQKMVNKNKSQICCWCQFPKILKIIITFSHKNCPAEWEETFPIESITIVSIYQTAEHCALEAFWGFGCDLSPQAPSMLNPTFDILWITCHGKEISVRKGLVWHQPLGCKLPIWQLHGVSPDNKGNYLCVMSIKVKPLAQVLREYLLFLLCSHRS